jgi:pantoate--beta-alanine ligase
MATPELVVLRTRAAMRDWSRRERGRGARLGFVPTMGALHAGHLSLVAQARAGCDTVVASIFVNPLQFGPGEDLERYPRDFDGDRTQLAQAGCDALFAPDAAEMYAPDAATFVEVADLQDRLCGATRPGHFRGVATVVAKLFHAVEPDIAVFGQKDAQQAVILRRMVRDLDFPVTLVVAPIVRDPDGLALSSRNVYLSAGERREALLLHASLEAVRARLVDGERRPAVLVGTMRETLAAATGVRIDYTAIVDPETLRPVDSASGRLLLAVAAFVGTTRLIDNLVLEVHAGGVREVGL